MKWVRSSYGYDSYRGRSTLQTILTVIICILLVVLLLAVAAFFLLQQYMVYTDDGRAHLELPFFRPAAAETAPPAQSGEVVVVTPEPVPTPEPTAPPPKVPAIAPVSLFRASITEGNALRVTAAAGGDAMLFNMKANDGSLGYVSDLSRAISWGSSAAEVGLNGALRALTAGETYTVARVSCFKDTLAPQKDSSLAIKSTSGYNWRDGDGIRWMDVSVAAARQYVTDVCAELAQLGFDEILLDNSGWPTTGSLENIRTGEGYDPRDLTAPVETFYEEVSQALADSGVHLALSVNAAALSGDGDLSGQTAALLGRYADRVYVLGAEAPGACDDALAAVGLAGSAVIYVDGPGSDLSTTGKLVTGTP